MSDTVYAPTIGIECHVQLKTKTKLFVGVSNDARDAEPNTLVSHVCLGMPGALPVLNQGAIELAMKAAYALGTKPQKFSAFDRKHYFYPDLPKGYQISQFNYPIIKDGSVEIEVDGEKKAIGVTRAHLEEDAGKNTHPEGADYSLVDLNRAGTPLLEIVSEPEIHSPAEAKAYVRELYLLMKYADVSDVDLYHGNMRFDVNVSVSKDPGVLGTRTETKNLNSFRAVEKTVEYEIQRQIEVLEGGKQVVQETRGWDDAKQRTFSQRSKEESHDYRYMPDPDIPPTVLEDEDIERAKNEMSILPWDVRSKLRQLGLDQSAIETIIDEPIVSEFVLAVMESGVDHAKATANWLVGVVQAELVREDNGWIEIQPRLIEENFVYVNQAIIDGKLSSTNAKVVVLDMLKSENSPAQIISDKNLEQVSDSSQIEGVVKQVLSDNPKAVADIKAGEEKAIGFLVGQVMKASKGKANPGMVQKIIRDKING